MGVSVFCSRSLLIDGFPPLCSFPGGPTRCANSEPSLTINAFWEASMADNTHTAESAFDNPITFEGIELPFNHTNDEWALANLTWVRAASLLVRDDDRELTGKMDSMARAGLVPELLDNIAGTKDHLAAIVKLLDMALTRSFVALERLGYSPDCPPPEQPMSLQ